MIQVPEHILLEAHALYRVRRVSPRRLASSLGLSVHTMRNKFQSLGLSLRSRGGGAHARSEPKPCRVAGCDRRREAKGLCKAHRYRQQRGLSLEPPIQRRDPGRGCSVDGCRRQHRAGGLCHAHSNRKLSGLSVEALILTDQPCSLCGDDKPEDRYHSSRYCSSHCARMAWSTSKLSEGTQQKVFRDHQQARAFILQLVERGYQFVKRVKPGPKEGQVLGVRRGKILAVRWRDPATDLARAKVLRRKEERQPMDLPASGTSLSSSHHLHSNDGLG